MPVGFPTYYQKGLKYRQTGVGALNYFKDVEHRVVGDLTHTDKTMNDTFWIGVQPALDEVHFDFVAEKMEELFGLNF